jgi:hypothetical protein
MLNIHADALKNKIASYHEFLSRYSKLNKVVYGFVEGKEDPCFYRGFIEHKMPEDWDVELWPAGNKNQVYKIHEDIDWRRFPKKRICFFVDRDLSDFIPEKLKSDSNIYVTDNYSIENDLVNRRTCQRVLTEVCGFGEIGHDEMDGIYDLFDKELESFLLSMAPMMAWILSWRRRSKNENLGNIKMSHLFSIEKGVVRCISRPNGKADLVEYVHDRCHLDIDAAVDISSLEVEWKSNDNYRKFTRGKFLLWFLVEFCKSVRSNACKLIKSCTKVPPMHVTLGVSNGMIMIGNRARIPASLNTFLQETFCDYISSKAA